MADDDTTQDDQDQRDADTDQQDTDHLGEKGRETIRKEREARKLAEKERAALATRLTDLEKAQKDRDDAEAKQKGEWEKVAQQRADDLAEAQRKLAERDLKDMKVAVAEKAGIPKELADLLTGTTVDELEAVAKTLAKHIAPRDAADTDAGKRSSSVKGATKPDNYLDTLHLRHTADHVARRSTQTWLQ